MNKLLGIALLLLGTTGCIIVIDGEGNGVHSWHGWESNEPVTAYGRALGDFHAVEVCDSTDVRVKIGSPASVVVTCPPALESFVKTEVKDGVLTVTRAANAPSTHRGARIDIVTPGLDAIVVRGSGDVTAEALDGALLNVQVLGSGDVVAKGRADKIEVSVQGSGDVKLYELASREGKVAIAGSGDVYLAPSEVLDVDIAGSGDVHYRGAARVTQRIAGSGDVTRN